MNDLKLGDKGARVIELQKNLQRAGYKLPRFGADGSLGRETLDAVDAFAGASTTDATPHDTVPYVLELKVKEATPQPVALAPTAGTPPMLAPGFVDARAWYNGKDFTTRNPWGRIDTICLHQMAVDGAAGWKRWDGLAIHVAVCTKGPAALLNDLDKRVAHGHAWNSRSVGFEIEGHFAGVEGEPRTHWTPAEASPSRRVPMTLSDSQILNALAAIRWCIGQVEQHGGKIKYVGAHRQSYGQKSSDPGELIWKHIALPIMAEFKLTTGPTLHHDKYPGRPIPEKWDPAQVGVKY